MPDTPPPNPTTTPRSTGTPGTDPTVSRPGDTGPVPLAVWPTPTPTSRWGGGLGGGWRVPPLLIQHLLAVYTSPAATVLAAGGSAHLVAATAARLDRRPPARTAGRRPAPGSVDLLLVTPPGTGDTDPSDGGVWRRRARLLTPTGTLAVVLAPTRAPGDPAAVVAACVGAGLDYLQHVVAVLWPLHDDHLDPPDHHTTPADRPPAGAAVPLPAAHADALIFTTHPATDPDPAYGPARGGRAVGDLGGTR